MRLVSGNYKGAKLFAPKGTNTRPTSDRVRESLFNVLSHGIEEFSLENTRILDLFAGTGALGLEALSRGANYCLFVEEDADARGAIRRNIETVGAMGITKIFKRDATRLGEVGTYGEFDILFADPPYEKGLGEKALLSAQKGGWLKQNAICVLEERISADFKTPENFTILDERTYGDTVIRIGRFQH